MHLFSQKIHTLGLFLPNTSHLCLLGYTVTFVLEATRRPGCVGNVDSRRRQLTFTAVEIYLPQGSPYFYIFVFFAVQDPCLCVVNALPLSSTPGP